MLVVKLSDGTAAQEVTIYNEVRNKAAISSKKEMHCSSLKQKCAGVCSGDDGERRFSVAAEDLRPGRRTRQVRPEHGLVCNGQSGAGCVSCQSLQAGSCPVTIQPV
jgi:hypothetical protein